MALSKERIAYLLQQYTSRNATKAEEQELYTWVSENDNSLPVHEHIRQLVEQYDKNEKVPQVDWEEVYRRILGQHQAKPVIRRMVWSRVAAAAVVVILLGAGSYFLLNSKPKQIATTQQQLKSDVAPGGNKATLTLANGTRIILDSAANGSLAQQGSTKIIKLDSGQLAYEAVTLSLPKGGEAMGYNTITTPRGGQYQVVLADGSKVWLNAASSIHFPTSFPGKERRVDITGEAYFEVAHNARQPFMVSVNGMDVKVLGTHFNINAYADEAVIKTTLLEGSVSVSKNSVNKMIRPGEQAILRQAQDDNTINVVSADVEEVMAWKNGKFHFGEGMDIAEVMKQIARWYDVDIEYKGTITGHIGGSISRNVNASQVFKMLEMTGGMKFQIEGRKVIVMQ